MPDRASSFDDWSLPGTSVKLSGLCCDKSDRCFGALILCITLPLGIVLIPAVVQDPAEEDPGILAVFVSVNILLLLCFMCIFLYLVCRRPRVFVEFEAGKQCPLDVVFVVDTSMSVGKDNFEKSKAFIREVVQELEMPRVQVGLIRFHHDFSVFSSVQGDREKVLDSLDDMPFEAGETRISPALAHAEILLKQAQRFEITSDSMSCCWNGTSSDNWTGYRQAVVLITDGESNDLAETSHEAKVLKSHGVALFCAHVGNYSHGNQGRSSLDQLVSSPVEHHAFKLNNYEELGSISDRLLMNLVQVTRRARRAKCNVDLSRYVMTADLSLVDGHDLILPGWEPRGSTLWRWQPKYATARLLEDKPMEWEPEHSIQRSLEFEPFRDQAAQTELEPNVFVEYEAGDQCPLDVVFLVDSSMSVGEANFEKSKAFIREIVGELEMPSIQVGLIRFHHAFSVISSLEGKRDLFLKGLDSMAFEPGETKISPALAQAEALLLQAVEERFGLPNYRQAVLLITDGESIDFANARHEAERLKSHGVSFFCAHVATPGHGRTAIDELVSHPAEHHAFNLNKYEDMKSSLEELLRRLVWVTRRAGRAKCTVDLSKYATEADLSHIDGYDIMLPGLEDVPMAWEPRKGEWAWEPRLALPPSFVDESIQADIPAFDGAEMGTQTEKLVKIRLGSWRQSPLDLVICIDSSASFCMSRKAVPSFLSDTGAFIGSGVFENVKAFTDHLASAMHMPEVQLGLIRFEDTADMICPMTDNCSSFKSQLHSMSMSAGETKFAPALQLAKEMLAGRERNVGDWRNWESPSVERAVLVITDGDPNDVAETRELVKAFQAENSQVLYVTIGGDGTHSLDALSHGIHRLRQAKPRCVFQSKTDNPEELQSLIPDILRQLLRSTRRIEQARCSMTLGPHEIDVLEDLDAVKGMDVLLNSNPAPTLPFDESWDPSAHLLESPLLADKQREAANLVISRRESLELTLMPAPMVVPAWPYSGHSTARLPHLLDEAMDKARLEQHEQLMLREQEIAKLRSELEVQREEALAHAGDKERLARLQQRIYEETAKYEDDLSSRDRETTRLRLEMERLREQLLLHDSKDDSTASRLQQQLHDAQRQHQDAMMQHRQENFKLHSEIESLCEQVRKHQKTVGQRDQEVGSLQAELAKLQAELSALRQQPPSQSDVDHLSKLRAEIESLHEKIKHRDERNAELERQLKLEHQKPQVTRESSSDLKELELLRHRAKAAEQQAAEQSSRAEVSEGVVDKLLDMIWNLKDAAVRTSYVRETSPQERPGSAKPKPGLWRGEGLKPLRQHLESQHGNLVDAFRYIDDNHSGHITMTEMIKGLDTIGLSRQEAQMVFRRLQLYSGSKRTGALSLNNWIAGFSADDAQELSGLSHSVGFGADDAQARSAHSRSIVHFADGSAQRPASYGTLQPAPRVPGSLHGD